MRMKLGNLDFKIGGINPSGIGATIYRIAKGDILSWPTIADDPNAEAGDAASLSTYDGDFSLKAGAKWDTIYNTQGKGKCTFEPTGETDCKMFTNKGSFSYPDLTPELLAFCKASVNGDFVFIAKSAGRFHVIGSPDYRTVVNTNGDTGDSAGSSKGATFEIECPDVTPLPIYKGKIALTDGDLDCATGTFTPAA